jgi:hypothetical protein
MQEEKLVVDRGGVIVCVGWGGGGWEGGVHNLI